MHSLQFIRESRTESIERTLSYCLLRFHDWWKEGIITANFIPPQASQGTILAIVLYFQGKCELPFWHIDYAHIVDTDITSPGASVPSQVLANKVRQGRDAVLTIPFVTRLHDIS